MRQDSSNEDQDEIPLDHIFIAESYSQQRLTRVSDSRKVMSNTRSEVSLHQNMLHMNTVPKGAIFNDQKVQAAIEATLISNANRSNTKAKPP